MQKSNLWCPFLVLAL